MSAIQRRRAVVPELLAGIGAGALLAALAAAAGSSSGSAAAPGPVLLAAAPFALATLTGVAKSSTP